MTRTAAPGAGVLAGYGIRPGYLARPEPRYFLDDVPDGVTWQPDLYRHAAAVARALGATRIVDVGCGNAQKLVPLHPELELIGIDFGPNLDLCRERYPFGSWREHDLERDEPLPVSPDELAGAVVVAGDVIEHLVRPELLLRKLRASLELASAVLLTTPERELTWGPHHDGPPPNPCHVREWTCTELAAFLESEGLEHGEVTLTRSNDASADRHTILAVLARDEGTAARLSRTS